VPQQRVDHGREGVAATSPVVVSGMGGSEHLTNLPVNHADQALVSSQVWCVMKSILLCTVLAGISLTACGSDAAGSSAATSAGAGQTTVAGSTETPATPAATIPVAGAGDLAQGVCDGIARALGEMAAVPGAVAEMYGAELLNQLSSLVDMDQLHNEFDEAAVKATCPADYAEFLTKAETTTLFGVSGP
jgi:hypothetical protein